jgi:hypothetical protein
MDGMATSSLPGLACWALRLFEKSGWSLQSDGADIEDAQNQSGAGRNG